MSDDEELPTAPAPRYGFSPKQVQEYKTAFLEFDTNGDGHADEDECFVILRKLGAVKNKSEVKKLIAEVDKDGNGTIEFDEFLWMCKKLQEAKGDKESSGGGLFGGVSGMFSGGLGGLFKKKEFDTKQYEQGLAERERKKTELENKYLDPKAQKKLAKARKQRAKTFT